MAAVDDLGRKNEHLTGDPRGECVSKLFKIMYSYGREFCFVLAIIFTAYAAFQSNPLKNRKTGPSKPFFEKESFVFDYYRGNIQHAFERMRESDLTFVFYYAPWDAACQKTRSDFETLAMHYRNEMLFVAVNCWWPEGECHKHFPKVRSFPVLMAYPGAGRGIQYYGSRTLPNMIEFLERLMSPLDVLQSRADLTNMLINHNAVVLGFFNFNESPQPPGFQTFYLAALRSLEEDNGKDVKFGVVSNLMVAEEFGMNSSKEIKLYLWNSTFNFPNGSNLTYTSESLLKWVYKMHHQAIRWVDPPGLKSLLLSNTVGNYSFLILMTPRLYLLGYSSPYFNIVKEIAMDYYSCEHREDVIDIIKHSRLSRRQNELNTSNFKHLCRKTHFYTNEENKSAKKNILEYEDSAYWNLNSNCCQSVIISALSTSEDYVCDVCDSAIENKNSPCLSSTSISGNFLSGELFFSASLPSLYGGIEKQCKHLFLKDTFYQPVSVCCSPYGHRIQMCENNCDRNNSVNWNLFNEQISVDCGEGDSNGDLRLFQMRKCELFKLIDTYSQSSFPKEIISSIQLHSISKNFTGLGCKTNKTLKFIAMDSVRHRVFFDRLGVNIDNFPAQTTLAIIDNEHEAHYVFQNHFNTTNIKQFIYNFTMDRLDRSLRSDENYKASVELCSFDYNAKLCIQEVTSSTFKEIILDNDKDVLLMIYAPWCLFCSGISHIFLLVARYFKSMREILFARINGDKNDLPWEFTVEKYPTILFFPSSRREDSVAFPVDKPITISNLVSFVLAHSQHSVRVNSAIGTCSQQCVTHNRKQSLSRISSLLQQLRTLNSRSSGVELTLCKLKLNEGKDTGNDKRLWSEHLHLLNRQIASVKQKLHRAKILHLMLSTAERDGLNKRMASVLEQTM